jgi:hypothetical protein
MNSCQLFGEPVVLAWVRLSTLSRMPHGHTIIDGAGSLNLDGASSHI